MSESKDLKIRGYFLKPKGVRQQNSLGNTDLVHAFHLISWKSILILLLLSHLRRGHPSSFFSPGFPHQNSVCISPPYVPHGPCIPFLLIVASEWFWVQTIQLLIVRSPLSSVTRSLLGPNIFLEHPQPMFLLQCERPSFTPIWNNRQKSSSLYVSLFLDGKRVDKTYWNEWEQ